LESQLKGLVKAIDTVSKQRAEFAVALSEFADTIAALSVSDLSKQLTSSLSVLTDVERLYKDLQDGQVKDDMVTVMGAADEYSRLISSVRLAFNSRIKLYFASQTADSEFRRIKSSFEKQRRQGRSTGSMAEIAEVSCLSFFLSSTRIPFPFHCPVSLRERMTRKVLSAFQGRTSCYRSETRVRCRHQTHKDGTQSVRDGTFGGLQGGSRAVSKWHDQETEDVDSGLGEVSRCSLKES